MSGYTLTSKTVHNAEGWQVDTDAVSIFTTKGGAMTAPVTFKFADGSTVHLIMSLPGRMKIRAAWEMTV